jgi:hypothetical protein
MTERGRGIKPLITKRTAAVANTDDFQPAKKTITLQQKKIKEKAVQKKIQKATKSAEVSVADKTQTPQQNATKFYCFTLNNYTPLEVVQISKLVDAEENPISYIIYGVEVGEKKKIPHLQGYLESNDKSMYPFIYI